MNSHSIGSVLGPQSATNQMRPPTELESLKNRLVGISNELSQAARRMNDAANLVFGFEGQDPIDVGDSPKAISTTISDVVRDIERALRDVVNASTRLS